jgi:hypothetical protein
LEGQNFTDPLRARTATYNLHFAAAALQLLSRRGDVVGKELCSRVTRLSIANRPTMGAVL